MNELNILNTFTQESESKYINDIKSCYKRSKSFSKEGIISNTHKLYIPWMNALEMMDKNDRKTESTIVGLQYFSDVLESYSKNNILANDDTVSAILFEYKNKIWFDMSILDDYTKLTNWYLESVFNTRSVPETFSRIMLSRYQKSLNMGYIFTILCYDDDTYKEEIEILKDPSTEIYKYIFNRN